MCFPLTPNSKNSYSLLQKALKIHLWNKLIAVNGMATKMLLSRWLDFDNWKLWFPTMRICCKFWACVVHLPSPFTIQKKTAKASTFYFKQTTVPSGTQTL